MNPADESDFHDFAASRWPRLFRIALLLTGDQGLAEDLAQSTLTAVCASWSRVRRAGDPDAYARRILLNAHLGRFRRKRPREVPLTPQAEIALPGVPDPPAPSTRDSPSRRTSRPGRHDNARSWSCANGLT